MNGEKVADFPIADRHSLFRPTRSKSLFLHLIHLLKNKKPEPTRECVRFGLESINTPADLLTKLAFISPAYVETIAQGEVSPETNLQMLMDGRAALPLSWEDQEQLFSD
jgi:hypothetical protein